MPPEELDVATARHTLAKLPSNLFYDLIKMEVEINRHMIVVDEECTTLAQLLEKEGFTGVGQAVAVNNAVVSRTRWETTPLCEGMKITVIRAVCGG